MDTTIRLWHVASARPLQTIRAHEGAITGLSLHATGDYVLSSSMDQYWAFSDFRTGTVLAKVVSVYTEIDCVQFPDKITN
jgi:pre-mRNA-processing factor 19